MEQGTAHELTADLFRRESARLLSALTRFLGPAQLALAEDVVQDALVQALEAWRLGVPENPAAWLLTAAKHRAIDRIRRSGRHAVLTSEPAVEWLLVPTIDAVFSPEHDAANQLAMMFSCCHEDLSEETHVTLILRFLCGLGPREIARAFLVDTQTIDRRIHRGRERLRSLGALQDPSDAAQVRDRLPSVLRALYLLFNEGYHGSDEDNPLSAAMCADAIRLVDLLLASDVTAVPEAHALQALFCFNAARLVTRVDAEGVFVPLAEQERSRWNRALLERGVVHLGASAAGATLTRVHLEAGIACEHTLAPSFEATDWASIVALYDQLLGVSPGPVTALNRALAVAELRGVAAGALELDALRNEPRLQRYPFYWAALADVDRRRGEVTRARGHYEQAIQLSRSRAERLSYERRLAVLGEG